MYKPTFIPVLDQELSLLSNTRFGIIHKSNYVESDNPSIEQLHIHGYLEIFFNISSDVSFLVNNNLYPVNHGNVIVSCANDIHMCIYNRTRVHEYYCLWIDCAENPQLTEIFSKEGHSPLLCFEPLTFDRLNDTLFSLTAACENNAGELEKASLLLQVLVLLEKESKVQESVCQIPESFRNILDYINVNSASIHCISDILENFFISASTLNRLFRRYTHLSARKYLESKKLSHAAKLLSGGETVTNACMASGFSDCSHFIRLFKKTFGETPFKYKQRFK